MPIRDWFMGSNEAKKRIEDKRKAGKAMTGPEFSSGAMKDAVRALNTESAERVKPRGPWSEAEEEQKRRRGGK